MKALWLREVKEVLDREEVRSWWEKLDALDRRLAEARERHEELLAQASLVVHRAEMTQRKAIDTLYSAGELEDSAAQFLAEVAEIENKSYEAVANFESQRITVSDLYSRMGAMEHRYLTAKAELEAAGTDEAEDDERRAEQERALKRRQEDLSIQEKRLEEVNAAYQRENNRKLRLWEEVEQMWARSLNINLSVAERRAKSRRARREAEKQFKEAEAHKRSAESLTKEAAEANQQVEELKQQIKDHHRVIRELCDCVMGEEFIYWPRRENNKDAYCVPLRDHPSGYNIEIYARSVYLINRQRGVEFIEPLPPEGESREDDDRLDEFFRRGSEKAVGED
ncbi:MAG: hypothetical protein JXR96_09270 [Deltaproteobacteria bacterium]|nr:hypothetical protein [Deltaproteobacteria bacterium]